MWYRGRIRARKVWFELWIELEQLDEMQRCKKNRGRWKNLGVETWKERQWQEVKEKQINAPAVVECKKKCDSVKNTTMHLKRSWLFVVVLFFCEQNNQNAKCADMWYNRQIGWGGPGRREKQIVTLSWEGWGEIREVKPNMISCKTHSAQKDWNEK